jgi:hypothetical protein
MNKEDKTMTNKPVPRITFEIDPELKRKIHVKCVQKGLTIKDVALDLLKDWLKRG